MCHNELKSLAPRRAAKIAAAAASVNFDWRGGAPNFFRRRRRGRVPAGAGIRRLRGLSGSLCLLLTSQFFCETVCEDTRLLKQAMLLQARVEAGILHRMIFSLTMRDHNMMAASKFLYQNCISSIFSTSSQEFDLNKA